MLRKARWTFSKELILGLIQALGLLTQPVLAASAGSLQILRVSFFETADLELENFNAFSLYKNIPLERITLGLGYDYSEAVLAEPFDLLGLPYSGEEGPEGYLEASLFTVWLEKEFNTRSERWFGFGQVGLGINFIDFDGPKASGMLAAPLKDTSGREWVPDILLGVRYYPKPNWLVELAARANYHFTGLKLSSASGGLTTHLDDYFAYGISLGVGILL